MIDTLNALLRTLGMLALALSVLVVLILLLRKPVRARLGAVAAYNLWLLLVLWMPLYQVGLWLMPWLRTTQEVADPAMPALTGMLRFDWPQLKVPLLDVAVGARDGADTIFSWQAVALVLWGVGCIALLLWQGVRLWFFVLHVLHKTAPVYNSEWETIVGRSVPAVSLPGMGSAALFGISSPTLLLPERFGELHDKDQQHIILAHESVHLRRNDNLWNLGASVLLVLFWWNPLLWQAWRCYRFDQELSCDALALEICNNTQQKRYARTLLDSVCELPGLGQHPALTAWGDLVQLKERTLMVSRHLSLRAMPATIKLGLLVAALAGVGVSLMMSAAFAPERPPETIPTIIRWTTDRHDDHQPAVRDAVTMRVVNGSVSNGGALQLSGTSPTVRTISSDKGQKFQQVQELLNRHDFNDAQKLLSELEQQADSGMLSENEQRIVWQMQIQGSIEQNDYASARAAAMKVLAINSLTNKERGDIQYIAAQTLVQMQQWQQAGDELQQWARQFPESVKASSAYLTAVTLYQSGDKDRAMHFAEEAVRLSKDVPPRPYLEMQASLYLQTQQWKDAEQSYAELARLYPDNESYQRQLAGIAKQVGK